MCDCIHKIEHRSASRPPWGEAKGPTVWNTHLERSYATGPRDGELNLPGREEGGEKRNHPEDEVYRRKRDQAWIELIAAS